MIVHVCNPSPWEVDVGEHWVQGHPQLQSEFEASLGYQKYKNKNKKKQSYESSLQLLDIFSSYHDKYTFRTNWKVKHSI